MVYLLVAPFFIACLWLTGFLLVTDFSVPPRDIPPFHRVLVIFPHADDDLAGLYGHPDHIACSEVVNKPHLSRFQAIPLWYVTFSQFVLERITLPEHLATIPDLRNRQASATLRVFTGTSVFAKTKAWYAHKSQRTSLTKGIRRQLPVWFFLSIVLFEYFAEAS